MQTVTPEYAESLIDFAPSERARRMGFAEAQLHGTVAAYNMLSRNRVAYVADEVGMGKTYVALGVMSLLRYADPTARIVVVAPRENIQLKWIKEQGNFVHDNWRAEDSRVRDLAGRPARRPVACGNFEQLASNLQIHDHSDLFLRATSFSVSVKQAEGRKRCRQRLLPFLPWIDPGLLRLRDPGAFRDMYGRVLNALIPQIDLLVIDEAHNFKHGFGPSVSNRNRVMGMALGHPDGAHPQCPWFGPRVKRVLMLSATPFEYDYADLHRQLDVFGFGRARLSDAGGAGPIPVTQLLDADDEARQRELVARMLVRRVQYLKINGRDHSKNMYRREWRRGGYEEHDEAMELTDPRQRLVVGLIQKKVAELLGDRRFNNSFQIGMLSSFESFMETLSRSRRLAAAVAGGDEGDEDEGGTAVFDGRQEATHTEKRGIDSATLEEVVGSYRDRFGRSLPHPKLDATADRLAHAFETGDKALVFVRRVATVGELKAKLDERYDGWIELYMRRMLPDLEGDLDAIFKRYRREKRTGKPAPPTHVDGEETLDEERVFDFEDDLGGTESFFAWFFRGGGPAKLLSGAAFQKNRLASVSSVYATFFEDDHVAWLLGRPEDALAALADRMGCSVAQLRPRLRRSAWGYFQHRTDRKSGYPRLYVFEAYQHAGLRLLAQGTDRVAGEARVVLDERYSAAFEADAEPPSAFAGPEEAIGVTTFFTELVRRPELRQRLWPDEPGDGFAAVFRRREQRRELLSAMARLGAAFIDLYLLAIRGIGGFALRGESARANPETRLVTAYLDLLENQMQEGAGEAFNAFVELSEAASAFDTILAVNFPDVRRARLNELAAIYGRTLQHQEPVGRMHGGVNKRMVRQFRMPGYPLVLATTDVLQEGEDLHTFCRRVIHYGISWTPSAMEQRTGRVDRIGSLVQRRLDGADREAEHHELIQVHYPHLRDTVERLQVRRVLERLNTFLRMVHESAPADLEASSRINVAQEILRPQEDVPAIEGLLRSAYPVTEPWLMGTLSSAAEPGFDVEAIDRFFASSCDRLIEELGLHLPLKRQARRLHAIAAIHEGAIVPYRDRDDRPHHREQPFDLCLRSQTVGDATLVRCTSPVGQVDLSDPEQVDALYDLQRKHAIARVCARYDAKHHTAEVTIEADRLFHLDTTQHEELDELVRRVVETADAIEMTLLGCDADAASWSGREGGGR